MIIFNNATTLINTIITLLMFSSDIPKIENNSLSKRDMANIMKFNQMVADL